jgi:hypothetical protein
MTYKVQWRGGTGTGWIPLRGGAWYEELEFDTTGEAIKHISSRTDARSITFRVVTVSEDETISSPEIRGGTTPSVADWFSFQANWPQGTRQDVDVACKRIMAKLDRYESETWHDEARRQGFIDGLKTALDALVGSRGESK